MTSPSESAPEASHPPVIVVHHLKMSRSTRILWALEELGVPYSIKEYPRDPKTFRAGPEIKKVHPSGRFPVVEIDGLALAESGAILEWMGAHLGDGSLGPQSADERVQYSYFMHFAEGSLMPPLLVALLMGRLKSKAVPFLIRPLTSMVADTLNGKYTHGQIDDMMAAVEGHLSKPGRKWFVGDRLTCADIQMSYPVLAALQRSHRAPSHWPSTQSWAERIQARPGFQAAIDKGGPLFPPM